MKDTPLSGTSVLFADLGETACGGEYGVSPPELVLDGLQAILIHHPAQVMRQVEGILDRKPVILLDGLRRLVPPLLPLGEHRPSAHTYHLHRTDAMSSFPGVTPRALSRGGANLMIVIKLFCIQVEKGQHQLSQGFLNGNIRSASHKSVALLQ